MAALLAERPRAASTQDLFHQKPCQRWANPWVRTLFTHLTRCVRPGEGRISPCCWAVTAGALGALLMRSLLFLSLIIFSCCTCGSAWRLHGFSVDQFVFHNQVTNGKIWSLNMVRVLPLRKAPVSPWTGSFLWFQHSWNSNNAKITQLITDDFLNRCVLSPICFFFWFVINSSDILLACKTHSFILGTGLHLALCLQ